jgi:hypothetical protein
VSDPRARPRAGARGRSLPGDGRVGDSTPTVGSGTSSRRPRSGRPRSACAVDGVSTAPAVSRS